VGIRKRGKTWLVTVELGRDAATGKRRRAYVTVASKRDAAREEARLRHQAATGLDLEPTRITVAEYLQHWLDAVRPNLAPTTYLRYEGLLRHQVLPHIGVIRLSKLRPLHVQHLYARLHEAGRADGRGGLSPRTLLHVHRVLSEALEQAVRWQIVHRNVCQAVEAPQPRRAEMRVLTPEQARRLLEVAEADDSVYGHAVILALHSGLRLGELLGLTWQDVDLERGCVTVRRALQHLASDGPVFREPKTARGDRTIPLGPSAVDALRRLRYRQVEKSLALASAYRDHRLVFVSPQGTHLSGFALRRAFYRLLLEAGLPRIRFHDLRHTHASLLLARGVHPKIVSERLGHASIAITLDIYSHVLPNLQEEAARDLDAWLAEKA